MAKTIFTLTLVLSILGSGIIFIVPRTALAQASPPPKCGNNLKETGEQCDGNQLGDCLLVGCDTATCKCKPGGPGSTLADKPACLAEDYEDYANCTGDMVADLNKPACLRVLPPCFKCGDCQLDDFIWLFVNMGTWGIRILPVVALVFFIWAGFGLLTSRGNPQRVQGSKKFLASVVIGVIIVLVLAWAFTGFLVNVLTGGTNIFDRPWYGAGGKTTPTEVIPEGGCCVTLLGCIDDVIERSCNALDEVEGYMPTSWLQGKSCSGETLCQNLEQGCCVPTNPESEQCQVPEPNKGCTPYPNTYLVESTSCAEQEQCKVGCCVRQCGGAVYGINRDFCLQSPAAQWHMGGCDSMFEVTGGCCLFHDLSGNRCVDNANKLHCLLGEGDDFADNKTCDEAVADGWICNTTLRCDNPL